MKKDKSMIKANEKKSKKESKFRRFLDIINKKWLVKGTTTLLLIAIIFGIYIGVAILLDKVELPQIDTTENKIYSLTDETKEKIGKIDKDVTITLINYKNNSEKENTINRYKEISNKIKVEKIEDVNSRPDLKEKYELTDSDTSLILVVCGDKEHVLTEDDLSGMDYTTYKTTDKTEQAVTNAIIDVTTDQKPKIYFIGTHTNYSMQVFGTLVQKLKDNANEVESLDILTKGKVPEDCNLLIIPTLKDDFNTSEKDSIITYINNGGEVLILDGPNLGTVERPNYQQILDLYGITMEKGVILEQSSDNVFYRSSRLNNRRCTTQQHYKNTIKCKRMLIRCISNHNKR